jgi:ectoine hydroxylase-related dioxygenase (phytanoyl-CoA dioxygenase family)
MPTTYKDRYEQDGFLRVPAMLDADALRSVELELTAYVTSVVPRLPQNDIVWEAGGKAIRNLWRMEAYSEFFRELASRPHIVNLVAELVNGAPVAMAVELFAKPARVGSGVPIHQDNGYFNLTPPDALTCWIALDASTHENGCVYYARGSHKHGLLPHKASMVPGNSWGLADPPAPSTLDEAPGILRPGDAMLHHCCTLHRSEPNQSATPRRGLLIVYKAAHCNVDEAGMSRYLAALQAQRDRMAVAAQA